MMLKNKMWTLEVKDLTQDQSPAEAEPQFPQSRFCVLALCYNTALFFITS